MNLIRNVIAANISWLNYFYLRWTFHSQPRPYTPIYVNPHHIHLSAENNRFPYKFYPRLSGLIHSPFNSEKRPKSKNQKLLILESKLTDLLVHQVPDDVVTASLEAPRIELNKIPFLRSLYEDFLKGGFRYPRSVFDTDIDYLSIGIDHDGALLFLTGKHRLAMARVARLELVPVNVAFRHESWQKRREEILAMGTRGRIELTESERCHPDIADLIE